MVLEQFQNGQHNVVDVAEPRRLRLLGVVQPPSPVDGDVREAVVQPHRSVERPPRVPLAELVQPVEDGAVRGVSHVVAAHLGALGDVWSDALQKVHVLGGVELGQVLAGGDGGPLSYSDTHAQSMVIKKKGC